MDQFPGYVQLPCLASPPPEAAADGGEAAEIARIGNDEMAEIAAKHPDRFVGFLAALPMNNPDAAVEEAERAVTVLGAPGVQIFTNVNGLPLDNPEFRPVFRKIHELGCPVWIHPARGMDRPDYVGEEYSKYELWWALSWPYETSMAMYRLVFSGLFEEFSGLKVIVHHGGGMIPMMPGRLGPGLEVYGSRTPPQLREKENTPLRGKPLDGFKQFYADTATFGSAAALRCAVDFFGAESMLFASDMPFDPEQGPGYIRETIRIIREMGFSEAEEEKIFSGNLLRMMEKSQKS
jgi:aminocarboxymuconate-semialdehyde decarboxylase